MSITASTTLQTKTGSFIVNYHRINNEECVTFSLEKIEANIPLVRLHSACLFGEAFHSIHCDYQFQLQMSMEQIAKHGNGVIVYTFEEGRGIGLEQKIIEMNVQQKENCDTVEAFKKLGYDKADFRKHQIEALALRELHVNQHIKLISGNPKKHQALENVGFIIDEMIHFSNISLSKEAISEKQTKVDKLGYKY